MLRGYDMKEVDELQRRFRDAVYSSDPQVRQTVREAVRRTSFEVRLRGYDRTQVDDYFARAVGELDV